MRSALVLLSGMAALASAKVCTNMTIPVQISARQGMFNIPPLYTDVDVTTFVQNFTSINNGTNYTSEILTGYQTVQMPANISAKFCTPDSGLANGSAVQVLTHGIGFDKTYWDLSYNNFNYSYENIATAAGYCTLAIDRFGIGNSTHGDPYQIVQAPAEISGLYQINTMLRSGNLPGVNHAFGTGKIINVGHSYGSQQSYQLATMYPNSTDALILTGFSLNNSFISLASFDAKQARLEQPLRFGSPNLPQLQSLLSSPNATAALSFAQSIATAAGLNSSAINDLLSSTQLLDLTAGYNVTGQGSPLNYPSGYITWGSPTANQYNFLYPANLDPTLLTLSEATKQPFTIAEALTLGPAPQSSPFTGPVHIVTGRNDAIYCGGDCLATGLSNISSIPAAASMYFSKSSNFTVAIPANTGHAITLHYGSQQAYMEAQEFLMGNGIMSS